MRPSLSPTLRSRYDYYYSAMSPASTANNFYENQNQSLFGDPVPPATDFLETLDSHLYGSLRRGSSALSSSNVTFLPQLPRPVPIGGNHLGPLVGMEASNYQRIQLTDRRDSNESYYSYNRKRSSSSFSDDFRANVDNFRNTNEMLPPIPTKRIFSSEPLYSRRPSNQVETHRQSSSSDSRESHEWHRPTRPASKNVVEINHVGDAMVAVIQDSTTSSSEERSPNVTRSATVPTLQQVLPFETRRRSQPVISTKTISTSSTSATTSATMSAESESELVMATKTRDLSPAIITQTVQMGSAYRLNPVRQHKKTSFAIINELAPNQSRATSPSGRISPFRGKGFKPSSRVPSRPTSPSNDTNNSADINRPIVQFNSKIYSEKIGPSTLKGILHTRQTHSASHTDLSYQDREIESYDFRTDVKHKTLIPSRINETIQKRPYSVLPESTKLGPSPAPRRKFYNSTGDLYLAATNSNAAENPKSYQKGLLHIVANGNTSPSKIPRRKSLTSGTELNLEQRRSSVSPKRRYSITTNDQNNSNSSIIDLGMGSSNPSRSGSRILKPTTLSPIIGTPNKDSEQEDENAENLASPTKIPVSANSSSNLLARANSRAASRSNSRGTSREPSPGLLGSKSGQTSFTRSDSKKITKSGLSSKSANMNKKTNTKVDEKIPPNTVTTRKPAVSPRLPLKKTSTVKSTKKEPSSTKKEPSSVKREPSNLKKPPTSIKREGSTLNKDKSSLKREPSNLSKETLKRQPSNLKREPSNLKREPSRSTLKRQTSKLVMTSVLTKNNSDSALGKKLEKQNSFKAEKRRTISESDGPIDTEAITATNKPTVTGRTDSKDKLVAMTKSNVVSMTTAAITAQPVQITTAVTNSANSLDSILTHHSSGEIAKDSLTSTDPASIIEKSQKTLENIQKTVTEATDEIHKTIEENLTDLKSLENDIKNDVKVPAVLEKKESTRTLGDKSNHSGGSDKTEAKNEHLPPTVITTNASPIEANVSIMENVANNLHPHDKDNDERISVRSVSMLPDVELESGNVNKSEKRKADIKTDTNNGSDDGTKPDGIGNENPSNACFLNMTMKSQKISTRTLGDKSNHSGGSDKTEAKNEHLPPTVITTNASPIEANVSIMENVANNLHPHDKDNDERISVRSVSMLPDVELESGNVNKSEKRKADIKTDTNNGSDDGTKPDGMSENGDAEERQGCCRCSKCCAPCFSKFCIPCRRLNNLSCCKSCKTKKNSDVSSKISDNEKSSCWKRMKCCGKKNPKKMSVQSIERVSAGAPMQSVSRGNSTATPGRCRLCLDKFLCCRKTNKIESTSDVEDEGRKCCCCFPCRKSKKDNNAWVDRRESILSQTQKQGCCSKLCSKLLCCRKKEPSESRRTSMNSKKQSIAPTLPPEDNRPKLDESLIEHASLMKGAIPILPICLAWFCLLCNCFIPGFGTICSGIFCLCLGVPRFSQHDGARVRIGSFVINSIVGVAQAFTLLFCLVGWGWSIWWGTIMLRVAKKRRKLKMAEDMEQEEQTTSSNRTSNPPIVSQNHRDVEAGIRPT